jgi:hypothetical protein
VNGGGAEPEDSMIELRLDTRDPASSLAETPSSSRVMRFRSLEWVERKGNGR